MEENKSIEMKPKRSKKPLLIVLAYLFLVGGLIGYYCYDRQQQFANGKLPGEKTDTLSGRTMIDFDLTLEQVLKTDENDAGSKEELNREPYKTDSLMGGQVTYDQSFTGNPIDSYEDLDISGGKIGWYLGGESLRVIDDDVVNPDEANDFNYFWSSINMIESSDIDSLTDDEVENYALQAEEIAINEQNPAAVYIGDVIRNLKGKNPTLNSVYYLMIANRIKPYDIVTVDTIVEYSSYLDNSYQEEETGRTLVASLTDKFERVTDSIGIVHWYVNGSLTRYAVEDFINCFVPWYAASNRTSKIEDGVMEVGHYKNISNYFIAEYFTANGNMGYKMDDLKLMDSNYSYFKPAFAWSISPKIEEIASAYYDIVEPMVYQGKFINHENCYQSTVEKLENKYNFDEVKSAIMTYEFWALQR